MCFWEKPSRGFKGPKSPLSSPTRRKFAPGGTLQDTDAQNCVDRQTDRQTDAHHNRLDLYFTVGTCPGAK